MHVTRRTDAGRISNRLTAADPAGALLRNWLLVDPLGYGLHQVLKVGEDVGVGFMAVFRHYFAVDNYVELPVGSRRKLE